jgi:type I restriction-modification system DNA methylase subunit
MTTWPDKEHITAFLNALADLMPEHFVDPLGEFYMHHISHGRLGQYFTPETITDFTTHSLISATTEPGQRVVDPACGSGRFLLSAAKINRHLLFYGADLDPICCKMAVLNMLFNSLSGEIAHMNTITNTFYRGYHLHTKLIDGYHHPYFIEFTEPEKSYIWLHPTAKK